MLDRIFRLYLILTILLISTNIFAGNINSPPPFADIDPSLQHYLTDIYNNFHVLEVTTTAPNDSRRGNEGTAVLYDNSGDYELWIKTDTDVTDWQRIENKINVVEAIIGDGGTTNYVIIDNTGDVTFVGGAGLAFGEIWVLGNASATAISGAGTFSQFTEFSTNGQSNDTTPDYTNDHITILKAGKYFVSGSFHVESVGGGAADTVSIEVRKNGGTVSFSNLHAHRKLAGGGGDIGSISISGLADLSVNDTIEVWLTNDDNATNLLVKDANLSLIQIGG